MFARQRAGGEFITDTHALQGFFRRNQESRKIHGKTKPRRDNYKNN
jgi:hypothetical protein